MDPAGSFGELLERGVVYRARLPMIGKVWTTTTWQSVSECLRNSDDFVRDPINAGRKNYSWIQNVIPSLFKKLANNMLTADGEKHRRLRTLVDQAFQRQSIERMTDSIQSIVDHELDKIELEFKNGAASVDFVPKFCRPIPLAVICELLGLPETDRAKFSKWFSGMSRLGSIVDILRLLPMMKKTMNYLEEQFEEVRKQPRPGLMSALVQAEENGDQLNRDELVSTVMILLLAGHETTVHLLSNSLLTLLQFPQTKTSLVDDWSNCDATIDEVLRWCAIIHITKPRFVARDMDFHNQRLVRGEMIVPLIGCANFDPAEFDNPAEFRIDRKPNRHMTFGNGPHVCIGMKLAKAETNIALKQLLHRWPNLNAAFDVSQPQFARRLGMRALKTLPLSLRN